MSLPSPNLDDRGFFDLVEEAKRRIAQSCPEWTDLTPGDPGMMLLELFAYLTEVMIYRLNRVPEKAYVEFLRLIGVKLHPPAAASVMLRFTSSRPVDRPVEIPRGTRVSVGRTRSGEEAPVFVTSRTVVVEQGLSEVEVLAHHCELVEAELAGVGSGLPGLSVKALRPPIIAPTGDELDLLVGVEATPGELGERARAIEYGGKGYRIWSEVESFANLGIDRHVYVADRMTGTVSFGPAVRTEGPEGGMDRVPEALAEVVPRGREIRLWYRHGGGGAGNIEANQLTVLKDPVPGMQVTNPMPATGGRAPETLENALIRGPQEFHSLQRAVTASDFELVALRSSGAVVRAKAFTQAALWSHATPGTVEMLLVPYLAEELQDQGRAAADKLKAQETEDARLRIQHILDERRPLGTRCLVNWVRYKTARVKARVVVHRGEDEQAVKTRVMERLYRTITPLPTSVNPAGWRFGRPLRVSNVYDIVLAEPGVSFADQVRLLVDEVPEKEVRTLASDFFQRRAWYAATPNVFYRSLNDGDGWEVITRLHNEEPQKIAPHPERAGLLALSTNLRNERAGSRVHVSMDCGETWRIVAQTAFNVWDATWTVRESVPVLLLATDVGLFEVVLRAGATPVQVLVDPANQDLGFYSVAAATDLRGTAYVAVAARGGGGVYLSAQGGKPKTFSPIGLKGQDVRVLAVQHDGPRSFLWSGFAVPGNEEGKGCFSWELRGSAAPPEGWLRFSRNWSGGSCRGLAFKEGKVLAATHHAGVVWLDPARSGAAWSAPQVGCGWPMRDVENIFQPVDGLAVDPESRLILAGGAEGVYRSKEGTSYELCSSKEFSEKVTLPETWLFCSGEHDLTVVSEHEAQGD